MSWYNMTDQQRLRETAKRCNEVADLMDTLERKLDGAPLPFSIYISEYYSDFSNDVTVQEWNHDTKSYDVDREATLAKVSAIARLLPGKKDKVMDEDGLELTYTLPKSGGTIKFTTNKEVTCTKKVVGKEWVEPYVREGHYKDIVEWECDEVLLLKKS